MSPFLYMKPLLRWLRVGGSGYSNACLKNISIESLANHQDSGTD